MEIEQTSQKTSHVEGPPIIDLGSAPTVVKNWKEEVDKRVTNHYLYYKWKTHSQFWIETSLLYRTGEEIAVCIGLKQYDKAIELYTCWQLALMDRLSLMEYKGRDEESYLQHYIEALFELIKLFGLGDRFVKEKYNEI